MRRNGEVQCFMASPRIKCYWNLSLTHISQLRDGERASHTFTVSAWESETLCVPLCWYQYCSHNNLRTSLVETSTFCIHPSCFHRRVLSASVVLGLSHFDPSIPLWPRKLRFHSNVLTDRLSHPLLLTPKTFALETLQPRFDRLLLGFRELQVEAFHVT